MTDPITPGTAPLPTTGTTGTEPYWRLDAIDADAADRVYRALRPHLAEPCAAGDVAAQVVAAYRGGLQVEEFVPDIRAFARHQAVKAAIHVLLAATLPGEVAEQVDMGWLEEQLATAAERVYATRRAAPPPTLADDIRTVLAQRNLHSHAVPGVWDPDAELAGQRCVECAARVRLQGWAYWGQDGPTAAEQAPAVVPGTPASPGGSQGIPVVVDGQILARLVMAALKDIADAADDIGCCPVCCPPCVAVKALLDAGQLDDIVRERARGWDWWDDANNRVDRGLLGRAWRLTECHDDEAGGAP